MHKISPAPSEFKIFFPGRNPGPLLTGVGKRKGGWVRVKGFLPLKWEGEKDSRGVRDGK